MEKYQVGNRIFGKSKFARKGRGEAVNGGVWGGSAPPGKYRPPLTLTRKCGAYVFGQVKQLETLDFPTNVA